MKDQKAISELKREGVIEVVIDVNRQQKENFSESIPIVLAGLVHDLAKLLLQTKLQRTSNSFTKEMNIQRQQHVKLTMQILKISPEARLRHINI